MGNVLIVAYYSWLYYKMACDNKEYLVRNIIIFIFVFLVGLGIGVIAGYFGREVPDSIQNQSNINSDADSRISEALLNEVNADQIRQTLKDYTSSPHLAGTPADLEQAKQLKQQWLDQGLDRVDILGYDVLLSYPKDGDPNLISLVKDNGDKIFESQRTEKILRPEDVKATDEIVPPYHAYSPPGDVTSQKLFYVNYGREEDFYWLKNNKSIDFNDSVVIARYGKIFRGDKVNIATEYGAAAVIIYTDPYDYTSPHDNSSYPDSWWIPGTGVQRGGISVISGDALTPFYPSLDSAYRIDPTPYLPKIPAHPIGYDDAKQLLQQLQGDPVPDEWKGSISGLEYKFGGSFIDSNMTVKVHITTSNVRRHTYNVVGYINGAVEPDRYVVVGNHRDAWVYGAVDPSSGTAAMVETSRAMTSVMKAYNWRPRRTIIFCSWGAEDLGIIGSTEFTEQFAKVLGQRAVAYINTDGLIGGKDHLQVGASPLLHTAAYKATKKVPNHDSKEVAAGRTTVYDTWRHFTPSDGNPSLPKVSPLGSASDYSSFQNVLGISCFESAYTFDRNNSTVAFYPLYHTVYETFYLVDQIMDPGFKLLRSVTQVRTEFLRDLSDSLILPFDVKTFSDFITTESQKILDVNEDLMKMNNLTADVEYFKEAISTFQEEGEGFLQRMAEMDMANPYEVREVNDKLMNLQRSFLDPQGLPGRLLFKNLLLAPSAFNTYSGDVFPTLTDSLHRIETNADPDKWEKVKKNMSIVTYIIHTAASTLRKSSEFTKV